MVSADQCGHVPAYTLNLYNLVLIPHPYITPPPRECPLTLAAEKGYTDLAELLLTRGANVETRTKKGCSPFFLACKEGFTEISIMLANNGASIEVRILVMVITATSPPLYIMYFRKL